MLATLLGLIFTAGLVLLAPRVAAQEADPGLVAPGTWQAHTSMRRVQAVAEGEGAMWAGTDGGLFRYDLASGEITRYTTSDGLSNLDIQSVAFDAVRGVVWVGYADGLLDRITATSGQVRTFFDIARADRYPQRGINRMRVHGDSLLIATAFGVAVFDVEQGEVRDTYDRFGAFQRGRPVNDVIAAPAVDGAPGFWVATADGVAFARQDAPNLRQPSAWTIDEQAPPAALSLAYFNGGLHMGRQETPGEPIVVGDVWHRDENGLWTPANFSGRSVFDLVVDQDRMYGMSPFHVGAFRTDGSRATVQVLDVWPIHSGVVGPGGRVWLGTEIDGLAQMPEMPNVNASLPPEQVVVPSGPLTNGVLALDVGRDGTLFVGYQPLTSQINGMSRFDGAWTSFYTGNGHDVARGAIRAVKVDSRGMAWGGSEGDGLMRISPDGEVVTFRADNSTLREDPGAPNYVVVLGVDEDSHGNIWVTNRGAVNVLHVWNEEAGWTGVPRPPQTPPFAARVRGLYIDSFDQKWVSLLRTTQAGGDGFMAVRTDPADPTETEAVAITGTGSPTTGTGLPHSSVRAFAQDLDGRMWLGTERGLATVFSPGSVIANPNLANPSWARTPDQASYFLRDLHIFAIAVDPAGRKWVASSSGAWLINADGNEVEAHFTPDNSPLPSAVVVDVAVHGASGTVWFATEGGVMSYRGMSVDPAASAERLRVFPNPYRPDGNQQVMIEGLVAETRIRVLTVDGQVVAAFDGRGGSATWDGRDQRTGQLVPSGVYLVAAAGRNGEGAAYGKIAVIR